MSHHTCHQPVILKKKKNQGELIGETTLLVMYLPSLGQLLTFAMLPNHSYSVWRNTVPGSITTEIDVGAKS